MAKAKTVEKRDPFLSRHLRQHVRFYAGAIVAAIAFVALGSERFENRVIGAGDAFFVVYLGLLVILARNATPDSTKAHARADDEGLLLIVALTLGAVIFSLTAIVTLLASHQQYSTFHIVATIVCVPLGWATVHASFATHYARMFYRAGDDGDSNGGLDIPGDDDPDIWDFMYFSFVLGMTAQTADIGISGRGIRRVALMHSIICFFYNTVIVALAVNVAVQSGG